jgi:hypothetical protein
MLQKEVVEQVVYGVPDQLLLLVAALVHQLLQLIITLQRQCTQLQVG